MFRATPPKTSLGVAILNELAEQVSGLQEEISVLEQKKAALLTKLLSNEERFVAINVGGKTFSVANSTLNNEVSFLSALTARAKVHGDSEIIMVDGDADVFPYILAYLRHGVPVIPPDRGLQQILLLEAKYYSLDGLVAAIMGHHGDTFPYDKYLPPSFLKEKMEEDALRSAFVANPKTITDPFVHCINVFGDLITTATHEPVPVCTNLGRSNCHSLLYQLLFRSPLSEPRCATVQSIADFQTNLVALCGDWILSFSWENVVLAGGAVLACVLPAPATCRGDLVALKAYFQEDNRWSGADVDLFLYGLSPDAATAKTLSLLDFFRTHSTSRRTLFIRTEHAITIECGTRRVQIILRLYTSPAEIIMGFDLDSCAAFYNGKQVLCMPRCARALRYGMNLIDPSRQSPSYVHRLVKYAKRGFSVGVPGLDRNIINCDIFRQPLGDLGGLARLIVLESLFAQGYSGAIGKCTCVKSDSPIREGGASFSLCSRHKSLRSMERTAVVHANNLDDLYAAEHANATTSNYATVFLPSGRDWNISRLKALLDHRSRALSWAQERIPFIHSDDSEVILDASNIGYLPVSAFSVSRTIKWMTENPGAQLTGSFHLLDDNFYRGAFRKSSPGRVE